MNEHDLIREVRTHSDIVDVISSYIKLEQKGKNYFGVCPFHDDTNPSMSVSRELQYYRCWSCGASGNVFKFVEDYEHVDFKDALRILANRAGIEIKGLSLKKKEDKNEKLYKIYELATKYYQNNLSSKLGKKAREYLASRTINDEIIKEYNIGLSLNEKDALTKLLESKNIDNNILEKIGLYSNGHDTYINRIMFPLHDLNGRVVGYSGRIYNGEDLNKYQNTTDTPIFEKGKLLYNYHIARDEVRVKKYLLVMEGFMDVIRASTIGYKNIVALMGTSMTKEQGELIKRLASNVILCFDGDTAGVHATIVNGEKLTNIGLDVKVINLPNPMDPDTYILEHGKESFDYLVRDAIPYLDFKIKNLKKDINMSSDIEKANYINNVIKEASTIDDDIRVEMILKNLAKEFDLEYNTLEKRLSDFKTKDKNKQELDKLVKVEEKKSKQTLNKYERAAMAFIYYMLKSDDAINMYNKEKLYLPREDLRFLASEISYYYSKYGNKDVPDIITYLKDNNSLIDLLTDILSMNIKDEVSKSELEDYISVIRDYGVEFEIKRLQKKMLEESSTLEKAKIADSIRKLKMGVE